MNTPKDIKGITTSDALGIGRESSKVDALSVFTYETVQIRTVDIDGEPWFAARDVSSALGYADGRAIFGKVPDEWKGVQRVYTPSGMQDVLCLSEHGLYFFLNRSDKPKAIPFQKWIAGEVLPSIRKTGAYIMPAVIDRAKSKEIRRDITDLWKERGATKWDYKNLTLAEYKALGYEKVSKVKKENMTRREIVRLAGFEFFEQMKLEDAPDITGYYGLKDSIAETGELITGLIAESAKRRLARKVS